MNKKFNITILIAIIIISGFFVVSSLSHKSSVNNVFNTATSTKNQDSSSTTSSQDTVQINNSAISAKVDSLSNMKEIPSLSTFRNLLEIADHDGIPGTGPFTIFAPTNDAFNELPKGTVENLLKPENKDQLIKFIGNHVVAGEYNIAKLKNNLKLNTIRNDTLNLTSDSTGLIKINGTSVITNPDIYSNNGIIQIINKVLTNPDTSVIYTNNDFGFTFSLPDTWKGFSIVKTSWEGNPIAATGTKRSGPKLLIRNPAWTSKVPYEDIPVLIFTLADWNSYTAGDYAVSAAPIAATELGRNNQFVFALPPRWDFDYSTDYAEAEKIVESKPLKAFNKPSTASAKLNIDFVCKDALTYMKFATSVDADKFVAECKDGKHPEVIEKYKTKMNLGDGAFI
jgi:uncharacterized surface protein with fasciclin (FAS1) repeats